MNVKPRNPTQSTDSDDRFVQLTYPMRLEADDLNECNEERIEATDTDAIPDGEVAVFAVAHCQGIIQNDTTQQECEGMAVLYLTADGTGACMKQYAREGPEDFSAVDRAFVVSEAHVDPAPDAKVPRSIKRNVRRHPEVRD